jgi:hypothetical protein
MDPTPFLTTLIGAAPASYLLYIGLVIMVATVVMRFMPAPTATSSSGYSAIYGVLHLVANLKTPSVPAAAPPAS